MDREILISGRGGQGVQLAAKVLAVAGMIEGRHVMQLSTFSGTMRGGSSTCTVVLADAPVESPPVVPALWAGLALHPSGLQAAIEKLRPSGLLLFDGAAFERPPAVGDRRSFRLPPEAEPAATGGGGGRSLAALGALAALTGIVSTGALERALRSVLPGYRRHTLPRNLECLRLGARALATEAGRAPAWPTAAARA